MAYELEDAELEADEQGAALLADDSALSLELLTRGEQIADRLVTAIALGEYVPGQRLPSERELSTALGVSRRTVRTALHHLATEGYLEIRRGRAGGAYVRSSWGRASKSMVSRTLLPRWEAFEDLFDLRRSVDQLVITKAVERCNENDLAAIREGMEAYERAEGRVESRAADLKFHSAIGVAARSPIIVNLSHRLRGEVTLGFDAVPWSEDIRSNALRDHRDYFKALETGDVEFGKDVVARHLRLTETAMRSLRDRVLDSADSGEGEAAPGGDGAEP